MKVSCIIIPGEKYSKIKDKMMLQLGGEPMLMHTLKSARNLFSDIVVVTRSEREVNFLRKVVGRKIKIARNKSRIQSAVTGIREGSRHAKYDYVFVLAANMPLVTEHAMRELLPRVREGHECIAYIWKLGKYEPLCAIYRKSVFYGVKPRTRMKALIESLDDKVFVPIAIETDEFFCVSTRKDLERAEDLMRNRKSVSTDALL